MNLKLTITNLQMDPRQVELYRINQFIPLDGLESFVINVKSENELIYYFKLRLKEFRVCIDRKDLSELSDECLKRIVKSLGVLYRAQAREELERIVIESLSCDDIMSN